MTRSGIFMKAPRLVAYHTAGILDSGRSDPRGGRARIHRVSGARVALALLATAGSLGACSGGGGEATSEVRARPETDERPTQATSAARGRPAIGCPRVRPRWGRSRPEFFPPTLAGLRLREDGCVYLVFPGSDEARPLWRAPAVERVRGLSWAPDGKAFAVATRSRVVVLRRDGSLLRRLRATGAAFLRDGRLAISRAGGIYLVTGSRSRRLASLEELERVTGFRARRAFSVSHDPFGFTRAHGRGAVAITLWSAGRSWKSVVLVVSAAGRVLRASPAYRAGGGEGVVSGWAWSPDGRELFVMAEVAGPPERRRHGNHDHCLDIWSAERGRRRVFCESQLPPAHHVHFAKLTWATDGNTALLDTGTLVTREGKVAGRAAVAGDDPAFQLQWEPGRG